MSEPIVIVHGWSDSAESFQPLAQFFQSELQRDVESIALADWVSLDDEVSFQDLRHAMNQAWKDQGLPTSPRSVDLVVHSTGALVVRDWMTTYFEPQNNPVKRLVMLAPANFGSPLAHKGRAFIARIIKGWSTGLQTGTKILKGLELGAEYTWELAERDILNSRYWYGANRTMATVFVGNKGYDGVKAAANEAGSDGTVRISTANLNAYQLHIDFSRNPQAPSIKRRRPPAQHSTAFCILDGDNHGSLIMKRDNTPISEVAAGLYLDALSVEPTGWEDWCSRLDQITQRVTDQAFTPTGQPKEDTNLHTFQNTVVRVVDDVQNVVPDYFIEFYENDVRGLFAEFFHRNAIHSVHRHSDDKHYRCFYVDTTALAHRIDEASDSLNISLTAEPEFQQSRSRVGYRTYHSDELGSLRLPPDQVKELFQGNRTALIEIVLHREMDRVVTISTVD